MSSLHGVRNRVVNSSGWSPVYEDEVIDAGENCLA